MAASRAGEQFDVIKSFKRVLHKLYICYHRSAVRAKGLSAIQELLQKTLEEKGKVANPAETRWLALGQCTVKLKNILTSVLLSLESESEERGDITATGMYHLMIKFEFLATLILLCDVLPTINRLSEMLQMSKLDFSGVGVAMKATVASLKGKDNMTTSSITTLIDQLTKNGISVKFKKNFEDDMELHQRKTRSPFISILVKNLESRFESSDIMLSFCILFNPTNYTCDNYPKSEGNLQKCLQKLVNQFGLTEDIVQSEFNDFVHYVQMEPDSTCQHTRLSCVSA